MREPLLKRVLDRVAGVSGGRAFYTDRIEQLDGVFSEIGEDLASQYLLAYAPAERRQGRQLARDPGRGGGDEGRGAGAAGLPRGGGQEVMMKVIAARRVAALTASGPSRRRSRPARAAGVRGGGGRRRGGRERRGPGRPPRARPRARGLPRRGRRQAPARRLRRVRGPRARGRPRRRRRRPRTSAATRAWRRAGSCCSSWTGGTSRAPAAANVLRLRRPVHRDPAAGRPGGPGVRPGARRRSSSSPRSATRSARRCGASWARASPITAPSASRSTRP